MPAPSLRFHPGFDEYLPMQSITDGNTETNILLRQILGELREMNKTSLSAKFIGQYQIEIKKFMGNEGLRNKENE